LKNITALVFCGLFMSWTHTTLTQANEVSSTKKLFVYSESIYKPNTENIITDLKSELRLFNPSQALSGYLGLAITKDTRSNDRNIYNDNYLAPLAGFRFNPMGWPIWAFTEYRHVFNVNKVKSEFRGGLCAYQWWDVFRQKYIPNLFSENYGELLYVSRANDNPSFQGWSKLGVRFSLTSNTKIDAFTELQASEVSSANLGSRLAVKIGSFQSQLILKKISPIPGTIKSESASNWAGQIVFTGEI
jgi:hypothetical protein